MTGSGLMVERRLCRRAFRLGAAMLLAGWVGAALAASVQVWPVEPPGQAIDHSTRNGQTGNNKQSWLWPIPGRLVLGYNPALPGRKGIKISGKPRQAIRAAAAGRVAYAGGGLPHDGRLIILKHQNNLLSIYAHLGKILVKEGENIQSGQIIAELGAGKTNPPVLHFEIRRNGKPVNPLNFLPARPSAAEV